MEDFDFNDTAPVPLSEQEFLMENLCVKKGRAPGGYEPPVTRSAAKRWKNINEQNMMTRLNGMHIIKKQNAQMSKEAAREIIRKIPVELLAKEWLSKEDATVDMRAYLVDHILPTLILGVEKLLKEVDEKGLSATNRFEPEFNPINFLAQYLMRNNPRFSNFAEASPYVRGLREVSEEIKQELFTFEDNRLARIKAETRRKRTDREKYEQHIQEEKERRHNQIISQYEEWSHSKEHGSVDLAVIQNALRSFTETIELLPAELQEVARFGHSLEPIDETGRTLSVKEFAQYISLFVEDLPFEVFHLFMVHMSKCAAAQRASADRENRKIILTNLFLICDYGVLRFMIADRKLGLLDRARIMTLFEQFWDMLSDSQDPLGTLRNPRRWPIVEVDEVDDILFDAWSEETDGGIATNEIETQTKLLEAIRTALHEEIEICAARDKAAKEKWKMEQLEQKSEGYRAKLYKYNVTDFMNLIQYPLLDTMEAPLRYFDNTDGKLLKDHDLYASTLTKTARERSKKPLEADPFEIVKSDEGRSSLDKGSKISWDDHVNDTSSTHDFQSEKSLGKGSKPAMKVKDKNTNSRTQHFSSDSTEKISSAKPVNRNNNTMGSDDNSSEDYVDGSKSYHKTTIASRQRRTMKRVVRFTDTSDESSEETEVIPRPQLNFRRPSPFSSEEEIVRLALVSHSLSKQPLLKCGGSVASVGYTVHRTANPSTLPPVRLHRRAGLSQRTWKEQRAELKETVDGGTVMAEVGDTIGGAEETNGENVTASAGVMANEDNTKEAKLTADENAVKQAETTTVEAEKTGLCEDETVEAEKTVLNEATKLEEEKTVLDEDVTAEAETTNRNGDTIEETKGESATVEDAEEEAEKLEEPSKGDEHMIISAADNQKNNMYADEKKDEITKCKGDNRYTDIKESFEILKTVNTNVEKETDERMSDSSAVNEVALENGKDQDKIEELESQLEQNVKDESAAEEKTDVEIMRELVASQAKLLSQRTTSTSPAGTVQGSKISYKSSMPVKNNFPEFLEDINSNRNVEDINVNSCLRTRDISTPSIFKDYAVLSTFSEIYLNLAQFAQLVETFVGLKPDPKVFATLVHYITDGYQDAEPEKTDKLLEARENTNLAKKKAMLNILFEKWDNDASGFLEVENVADVMCRFKDGQEVDAIRLAQFDLKKQSEFYDSRLSKREFRQFVNMVIDELPGKETFDLFVEFLMNSVERSYGERIRGEARKKWIQQINLAAQTSGTSMDPVYKAVFQALYKDAETHGGEKRISASISLLETNKLEPSRGELLLRYAACTPEDCQYMLGKPLYKNMKGISFQVVDTGKPVHVPRVANHGNVYFWNYDRLPAERGGSFVAVPLKDNKKRVFGVLGVDTMIDPRKDTIFVTHEIQFFQGVAKAFSIGYHFVERKRKFLRVLESAISWFHRRCPHIVEIAVYFMEPSTRVKDDFVLRKMMVKDKKGAAMYISELIRLERKENLFRKYLFDCMETSQTIPGEVNEARHTACPIRDNNGIAIGIVDLNTGQLKTLPRYESREAQRMLRLLQIAYMELTSVAMGEEPNCVLEVEKDPAIRTDVMFDRLMLQELRDNIARLDPQSYVEIKGYYEPPRVIQEILRATMAIFKVDQVGEGEYDDWEDLKNCINGDLIHNIKTHDPIMVANLNEAEKVEKYLKAVPFGEIAEQGSIPAQQLYNWVFTCLSLIEYILKLRESAEGSMLANAGGVDKLSTASLTHKK